VVALRLALAVPVLLAVSPASADPVASWQPFVTQVAQRFGLPEGWILRVLRAESGGHTEAGGRPIRSRRGAMGLMQLMPATWSSMRQAYALGTNPDDPRDNIVAGTAYLRLMYDRFGYPGLFAAYNAGPTRYADYLAGRVRLPGETVAYLSGVTRNRSGPIAPAAPPAQMLFALRHELAATPESAAVAPAGNGLFAVRKGGE